MNPDHVDWVIAGTVVVGAICLDNKTVRVFHADGTQFHTGLPCGEPGRWGGYPPTWFPEPPPMYGGPEDEWLECFTDWQEDMVKCSKGSPQAFAGCAETAKRGLEGCLGQNAGNG